MPRKISSLVMISLMITNLAYAEPTMEYQPGVCDTTTSMLQSMKEHKLTPYAIGTDNLDSSIIVVLYAGINKFAVVRHYPAGKSCLLALSDSAQYDDKKFLNSTKTPI